MDFPKKLSLFKRNNGYYYISFEQDGKQIWRSTRTKNRTQAVKKLTDFKNLSRKRIPKKSLSVFINDFLNYGEHVYAKKTLDGYRHSLYLLKNITGDIPLKDVSPKFIDSYKTERIKFVSHTTVNIELRFLKSAFNTAKRWELLELNPCDKVSYFKVPEVEPVYLKREEVSRLLDVMPRWLRDITVYALHTGCRRGEILSLQWSQIDFDSRLIHIQSNSNFRTKHGKRRQLPMSETVYNLLLSRKNCATNNYVFTKKGLPITGDNAQKQFKKSVRKAKIDDRIHFHSLRHSAASYMIQAGVPIFLVSKILGHSSVQVTKIYSHVEVDNLRDAVEKITFDN